MKKRRYGPCGVQAPREEFDYAGLDGVARFTYDGEKKRATAPEMSYAMVAYMLYTMLRMHGGETLEARLRMIPGAWQRWRTAVGMLGRALDALFVTMPPDQCAKVNQMAKHGQVDIHLPRAVSVGGENMIVSVANFTAIMEAALDGQCRVCFKSGGEAKRCALFKALEVEAAPRTWETVSGCVYRDIAMNGVGHMTERAKL